MVFVPFELVKLTARDHVVGDSAAPLPAIGATAGIFHPARKAVGFLVK